MLSLVETHDNEHHENWNLYEKKNRCPKSMSILSNNCEQNKIIEPEK